MSTTTTRIRLFANSEDYLAWTWNNCRTCVNRDTCDLNRAIASACVLDGTVSQEAAMRLGVPADGSHKFWCAELVRSASTEAERNGC